MRQFLLGMLPLAAVSVLLAAPPGWWGAEGTRIVEEDGEESNYAPANLGQLKHVAKMAKVHLDTYLSGGSGTSVSGLVAGFVTGTNPEEIALNYAPLNIGQLKALAKPFYDRLHAAGYDTKANLIARGFPDKWTGTSAWAGYYPWNPATPVSENYAPANIGQLKMTFSFDLAGVDSDNDGLPDAWEISVFGSLWAVGSGDADGDGLTNLQEFQQDSDPKDYFSQGSSMLFPAINIVGGDNQAGPPNQFLAELLVVEVRSGTGGTLLINAPVTFSVNSGGGLLAAAFGGTTATGTFSTVTGSDGRASAYFLQGSGTAVTSAVLVTSSTTGAVSFTTKTTLADGLSAQWKFEEGTGTDAAEITGLTVSGTLVNGVTWIDGFDGRGGVKFDGFQSQGGTDGYITMGSPSDGSLDFGKGSFSISLWLKFTNVTPPSSPHSWGRRIISKGHHGWNPGYFVGTGFTGHIWAGIGSSQNGNPAAGTAFGTAEEFNDGKWHHVVVVFERENARGRIYVDGVAQELVQDTGSGGAIDALDPSLINFPGLSYMTATREDQPLTVSSHSQLYDFYEGEVDDVSFYRKSLDQHEVLALYDIDLDNGGLGDGLSDRWEWEHFGTLAEVSGNDPDNDGLTNLQEFEQESDPKDYFSQGSSELFPAISIVEGNNQAGLPSQFLAEPLVVEVRSGTGGTLLINAPVTYSVNSGGGSMAAAFGGTAATGTFSTVTGSNGRASAYYLQGSGTAFTSAVLVSSSTTGSASFTAKTSLADGLWAKWRFDEGTGATAADSSGIAVSGSLVNGTTWGSGYDGRGGVEFKNPGSPGGSKPYVTMANPADRSLDFGKNSFSISLWLNFTSTANPPGTSGRRIVSKGHHGWNPGYFVAAHNGGEISSGIGSTAYGSMADGTLVQTTEEFNDGHWHHVVVTNDWENKKTRIYVDGVAQPLEKDPAGSGGVVHASEPDALDFSGLAHLSATRTDIPFTVSSHAGGWDYFEGEIDDLRIYRKALVLTEVEAIYNFNGDADSLPDWWEWRYLQTLAQGDAGDQDVDGLTNLQEFQQGSDPSDYYDRGDNDIIPVLTIVGGDNQDGEEGQYLDDALEVRVTDAGSGLPLVNAPVLFSEGHGNVGLSSVDGQATTTPSVATLTGGDGKVGVFARPEDEAVSMVRATAGEVAVRFVINSHGLPTEGMKVWLKADQGVVTEGGEVVSWEDQSGNNRSALPTNAAYRPKGKTSTINGKAGVRFDGIDDHLGGTVGYDASGADTTLICVHRRTALSSWAAPLSLAAAGAGEPLLTWRNETWDLGANDVGRSETGVYVATGTNVQGKYLLSSLSRSGGTAGLGAILSVRNYDGQTELVSTGTQSWVSSSATGYYLGRHWNHGPTYLKGEVLEALIYNRALTNSERIQVENYLKNKYALADSDGDGLQDGWETQHGLSPTDSNDAQSDLDGDGRTNLQEFEQESDPNDYYNGTPPTLEKLSGDGQTGAIASVLPNPLIVRVTTNGTAPDNAPVAFSISGSLGQIATSGTGPFGFTAEVRTGTTGMAAVYLQLSGSAGATHQVQALATSGTASTSVTFSATTQHSASGTLSIISGNNQTGRANEYLGTPLTVEVRNDTAGTLQIGAPVTYTVTSGTGGLATQFGGTTYSGTLPLVTGSDGRAQAYFRVAADATNTISVTSGTSEVVFTATRAGGDVWSAWAFNDGHGNTALETTGLGADGTLTNYPLWSEGFDGMGGITFSGSNSYVTMGQPIGRSLDLGGDSFTVAFWVRYTEVPGSSETFRIVSKGFDNFGPGFFVGLKGDGKLAAGVGSTSGTQADALLFKTTTAFNDGEWHHFVVTFDRTNTKAQIYVDGTACALEKESGTGGTVTSAEIGFGALTTLSANGTGAPFTVASFSGTAAFFKGDVDEVQVHRSVLTAGEVTAAYDITTDGDTLSDRWEWKFLGTLAEGDGDNHDGDDLTNLQEYLGGTDPNDYYSRAGGTIHRSIAILSGDNQTGSPSFILAQPLRVIVRDTNNNPLVNAPIRFTVLGVGSLLSSKDASPTMSSTVRTDAQGHAQVYFWSAGQPDITTQVVAIASQTDDSPAVTFTSTTNDGTGPPTPSPFPVTDIQATLNDDGSVDVTWVNQSPENRAIPIKIQKPDGSWQSAGTAPAGSTSFHIPAP